MHQFAERRTAVVGSIAWLNIINSAMEHELRSFNAMPTLKKASLARYLRGRFGPQATLLTYGAIGKESSQGTYKQYGYGSPVKLTFQIGRYLFWGISVYTTAFRA